MNPWGLLGDMVGRLSAGTAGQRVIGWACPVPHFGAAADAAVATVGLNPSCREFCSPNGQPLQRDDARFPTLASLGLKTWGAASHREFAAVADACERYFIGRPFVRWFGVLDTVLRSAGVSYYSRDNPACHLDLSPYTTSAKWGTLPAGERREMINVGSSWFLELIADGRIELLILNGASVVASVTAAIGIELHEQRATDMDLPRRGVGVEGRWYETEVAVIDGQDLGRLIRVVGWNHNLQSSFGVTRAARDAVARRLAAARAGGDRESR